MSKNNESDLVRGLVSGDEHAFQELFIKYYDSLVQFAKQLTKSEAIAEELVQETFMKVWNSKELIDPENSFKAYLYKITKNLVINFIKRAAHEERIKQELWHSMRRSANDTEETLLKQEFMHSISLAVKELTPKKQLIYKLSRDEGKTHEEIATQLGLSKSTVKNHLVQTLSYIRHYLQIHMDIVTISFFIMIHFLYN